MDGTPIQSRSYQQKNLSIPLIQGQFHEVVVLVTDSIGNQVENLLLNFEQYRLLNQIPNAKLLVLNLNRRDQERALEVDRGVRDFRILSKPVLEVSAFNADLLEIIKTFLKEVDLKDCICCRSTESTYPM